MVRKVKNKIRKLVQDVKDFLVEAKEKVSTSFAKKFNELKLRADNLLDDIANFKPGQKLLSGKAWGEKTSRSAKKLRDVTNDALKLLPDEKRQKDESADDLFGGLRAKQTGKGASIVTEPTRDEFVRDTNNRIKQERNKALREEQKKRRENELRRVERNTVQDDDGTFSSARDALVKAQEEVAERKREAERKAEADRKQKEDEAAYKLHGSRRKYDEIASIKVGKVGSKENIKNLLRATEAISEATEMDNARVAYEKAKELAETIPNKKSRQAKLDEIEQSYAQKRNELKTDTFASREKMEANKAKRDEKRTEAEEEKRKRKDRIRERVRNRKRDSGSTEQSEPQSPVASGEQNPVSDKGTETSTPSDTSTPAQSTKPTSVTKSERKDSGGEGEKPTISNSERSQYPKDKTDEEIAESKPRKTPDEVKPAIKDRVAERNRVAAFENENKKRNRLEDAVAMESERINPEHAAMVKAIGSTKSVKINGVSFDGNIAKLVKAREYIENGVPFETVWEAFKDAGGSVQSRRVLERGGWVVPRSKQQYNSVVQNAVDEHGAKAGDIVKFDGTVQRQSQIAESLSPELLDIFEQNDTPMQEQVVQAAEAIDAETEQREQIAFDRALVATNVSMEQVQEQAFEQIPEHFIDDEFQPIRSAKEITPAALSQIATDKNAVAKTKGLLRKFLDNLQKAIASVLAVVAVGSMTIPQDAHAHTGYSVYESGPKIENVSQQASDTIHWVTQNKDHNGKAFVVADKAQGKIHIVDTDGKILNTQNAIFGKNKGDNAAFGNTPSGRFLLHKTDTKNLTETDRRVFGDSVLDLTDKETGRKVTNDQGQVVAMHRVVNTAERKAALNSATPNDNYLSHGCINIPTAFYNSAVDKLDGAMVYVLNQDGSSNMSRDTVKSSSANNSTAKSSNTTRDTSNTVTRGSSLAVPSASPLKFSVKAKNITQVNENVSPEKLQKSLTKALGKFADHISFISREQMGDTAGMQYFIKNGVEGFYDPKTQHAFIVADNIEAQNGISAEERLAFVAWHELTHLGLDVKHGEQLHNILDLAGGNPFIAELARAIQMERTDRGEATSVSDRMAVEEALAELNAALKTDNVKALEERYGVEVPAAFKEDMQSFTDRFIDRIKQLVRKVLGKPSLRNDQIRTLLAGLDESIAKHATPESRMLTERINAYMNDPRTALGDAPRFSIGKVISSAANNAAKFIENMVNKPEAFSPAGAEPSMINAGVEKQKRENALTAGEKFVENFADSDIPAIKYMGGYGTKIAQLLKATKNRVAKQHRKFHNKIQFLQAKAQATAKRMQRKGIYTRNNRHLIDIDVQTGNTALAAITQVMENGKVKFMSMNNELIDKYQKMINGYDAVDQNGNPYHVNGLKDELEAYGYDFANKTFPNYTPYQRQKVNSLLDRYKKATEILAKTEQSQNLILSTKGVKNLDEAKVLRKNLRGHNGMTVAESYNAITRLVKQGKLEITYDGKPWLDYIKDVGFTEDVGFKDITKDYTLNIDKLEVKGEIAQLMKDARDLAKEMYQYAEKEVGKDLTGISHGHPFFTPTMGESKDLKAWYNFDPTDNTAKIEGTQTIDDKITNDEAAEWQSQRLGRAFVGTGMAENLSLLADQVSRRAGWQAIAQQMIKDNDAKLYKVRIIPVTDPKFADTTGIVTAIPLANGKGSRYVKVMLNDTQANAALFGDNIATVGQYGVAKFMSFFNRIVATAITATPIFSVNNAYRGLREKHNQIEAWSGRLPKGSAERYFYDHLSPEIQKELEGGSGTKFGTRLFWTTAYNIARGFIKEGWFGAAVAFAYDMATQSHSNKNHRLRDFFAGGRSKAAYAKLKAIYDAGGISTRSESFGYSANELSKIYGTGGFWSKGIAAVENFQERAMVFTTAMELVSTLATVDTLNQFGMPRDVAVQANLHFMNFNDRGASATSAWVRASIPFANATTQGARSTTRSVKTRNGWKAGMRRMGMSFAGMMLSAMLRDMFPCDEDLGEESLRDRNDAELMRDLPIRIGCSFEIRLPIAYGADMIFHAAGVSAYQWMTGNWNARQALLSIWHAALENSSPVPQTPANNSGWVQGLTNPIIPRPVRVIWNIARDRDDFDNPLSRQGADDRKVKYLHSKKNTSEVWRSLAQGIHVMGMGNLTPEQARYLVSGFAGPYVVDNIDAATKPLKEGDSRLWKMIKAASGAKSAAREVREPGQASYVKVQNNLKQYQDITDRIDRAIEDPTEKLKFGVTNANTQSWLKKRVEDGTFSGDDIEKAKVILEWRKRQARINSKEVSEERKEQLYLESNEKYLKAIHALEGKGPRW